MNGYDVRIYERLTCVSYLFFSLIARGTQKPIQSYNRGIIQNLSAGGLFFETISLKKKVLQKLARGNHLFLLQFDLGDKKKNITLKAKLCWYKDEHDYLESNKSGFGIEFVDFTKLTREKIFDYITGCKQLTAL
jgi:hypothetical protein